VKRSMKLIHAKALGEIAALGSFDRAKIAHKFMRESNDFEEVTRRTGITEKEITKSLG
jgi:hypothetical protein